MKKIILNHIRSAVYLLLVVPVLMNALINNSITSFFELILYFSYIYTAFNISNKLGNWVQGKYNK